VADAASPAPGPGAAGPPAHRRRRLGLRNRITVTFGLGALLLSAAMGTLSYLTVRHVLVSERETSDRHQSFLNASYIRTALSTGVRPSDQLFSALDTGQGARSVLIVRDKPFSSSLSFGPDDIPPGVRALVASGTPASQNVQLDGSSSIVVGVPLPAVDARYYEVFNVGDLAHTLQVLALALAAAGVITTVLGAAVGRWASARALRPLTGVSGAAVAIAGGQLGTRLPVDTDDPDLAGLTLPFNEMVDQLQERIEREARFTSDVSHELRSPLTTLSASLEVLEAHRQEMPPRARQALLLLADDLRRFERMVGDLLEISRSDTGKADLALDEVAAGELVRRAVEAGSRSLPLGVAPPKVVLDPAVVDLRLTVDKRRVERVLGNLLENAALYGGGATEVRAEPGPDPTGDRPRLRIVVEDHGPGIPAAERSRVFERFYRGQASGRRGTGTGTGLGLALVAEHVRLHGGRVWVEPTPGGGARFVVELPVRRHGGQW
jgi:signal transduction histidine kinase